MSLNFGINIYILSKVFVSVLPNINETNINQIHFLLIVNLLEFYLNLSIH